MKYLLGRAALATALAAGLTGVALAAVTGGAPAPMNASVPTATVHGTISGNGLTLHCKNVKVEFHDSKGNVVATSKTRSNGAGGCSYKATVPALMELSTCPGLFTKESVDLPAFTPAIAKRYNPALGRESLGTVNGVHLYSNVIMVKPLPAGGHSSIGGIALTQGH